MWTKFFSPGITEILKYLTDGKADLSWFQNNLKHKSLTSGPVGGCPFS